MKIHLLRFKIEHWQCEHHCPAIITVAVQALVGLFVHQFANLYEASF